MSVVLTKVSLESAPWLLERVQYVVSQDAAFMRGSYPLFEAWFASKVLPGLYKGERTLVVEERHSVAVGLLILKHTSSERKLCTLRIRPCYESRGLGVRLFQKAFELLETERPLLSVSEPSASKFCRIFKYFGFTQQAVYAGRYLPTVRELAYNGLLDVADTTRIS